MKKYVPLGRGTRGISSFDCLRGVGWVDFFTIPKKIKKMFFSKFLFFRFLSGPKAEAMFSRLGEPGLACGLGHFGVCLFVFFVIFLIFDVS